MSKDRMLAARRDQGGTLGSVPGFYVSCLRTRSTGTIEEVFDPLGNPHARRRPAFAAFAGYRPPVCAVSVPAPLCRALGACVPGAGDVRRGHIGVAGGVQIPD